MKLSKRIKNPILSIETILENGMCVANNAQIEQVIISRNDTMRMLNWIKELKEEEISTLSVIENALNI